MGYEYKAVIAGIEYFDADIYSCVAENCTMASNFEIGNVSSARLDIAVIPKPGEIPRMANVDLYSREGGGAWREKGKYFIAKRVANKDNTRLSLECYDVVRSFEAAFRVFGLQPDWPMSMADALQAVVAGTGVAMDPRTMPQIEPSYMLEYPNDRTIREVLGDIASAHAGNFIITDAGLLRLVPAGASGASYDIGLSVKGYRDLNGESTISRVTLFWDDDEFFTAGSDTGAEIVADNPNATQQMADGILRELGGFTHHPFEAAKAFIDPTFELGDVVVVGDEPRIINGYRMHFSAEIATDLSNPSDDEIDDEFEFKGDMQRAFSRTVKEGSRYYGVSITRKSGLEIARDDGVSKTMINSDVWEAVFDGIKRLYFDMETGKFIFNGELGADVIIAREVITNVIESTTVITNNLYAEYGSIADLTVARLRTDMVKPARYLAGDTSAVDYIYIEDEAIEFRVDGVPDANVTEQFKNPRTGELFWWRDAPGGDIVTDQYPLGSDGSPDTANPRLPVIIYHYEGVSKASFRFEEIEGVKSPVLTMGYGTGVDSTSGVAKMWKGAAGWVMAYYSGLGSSVAATVEFKDDGMVYINGNPVGGLGNFDALEIDGTGGTGFTVTVGNQTFSFTTPRDGQGRIVGVNGEGRNRPVTYT